MRWVFGKREFSLTSPLSLTYKLPTFLGVRRESEHEVTGHPLPEVQAGAGHAFTPSNARGQADHVAGDDTFTPQGPAPIRCKKRMCFLVNSAESGVPAAGENFSGSIYSAHRQAAWHHRSALTTGRGRRSDVVSYFRRAGPAALAG